MRARPIASLALLLLVPLVLGPSPARAGIGDACPDPSDAVFEFSFDMPRGGSAAACRTACKAWTKACRKIASAARSCRQVLGFAREDCAFEAEFCEEDCVAGF